MENRFTDHNVWFDYFQTLNTTDEKLEFYHETLNQPPLNEDFIEQSGMIDEMFEVLEDLTTLKRFGDLEHFQQLMKQQQPEFYARSYKYIDKDLLEYYLFIQDDEKAYPLLEPFRNNPNDDIDIFLPIVRLVALYGKTDWISEIAEASHESIKDADGYVGEPEEDIALYALSIITEKFYKSYLETGIFDTKTWDAEIARFDFQFNDLPKKYFLAAFTDPLFSTEQLKSLLETDHNSAMSYLEFRFQKYMFDEKQMPFVTSRCIFGLLMEYWYKASKTPKLKLEKKSFDKFLVGRIGFFKQYFSNMIAALYGSFYVYDFLFQLGLINEFSHREALTIIRSLKRFIHHPRERIWRNGFTKNWAKPDAATDIEFEADRKLLEDSFAIVFQHERKKESFEESVDKLLNKLAPSVSKNEKKPNVEPKWITTPKVKVGRNEPCNCGSGKKYKNCCGK